MYGLLWMLCMEIDDLGANELPLNIIRDFKIYDAAARRRGLRNKRIICARQSEWIICSPRVF